MTINDLSEKLEIAKQLGFGESFVCINDSRDGEKSYPTARADFVNTGNQMQPEKIMAIGYA